MRAAASEDDDESRATCLRLMSPRRESVQWLPGERGLGVRDNSEHGADGECDRDSHEAAEG